MRNLITLAISIVLFPVLAVAHGGEEHVMGTVAKIEKDSITVKTTANKVVTVVVNEKTQFLRGDTPASLSQLKQGDRVVIHARKDKDRLIAHTVKFGTQASHADHQGMQHQAAPK